MKSKRSKACDISQKVKNIVWERDGKYCVNCGNSEAMPNAHYIPRSQGGLGIEENVLTLCNKCHALYDQSSQRNEMRNKFKNYFKLLYPDWDESKLTYHKD